ncbi:MAG: hypothetical protein Ct9H300mP30_2950 [Methanobacteriota archaeon]|nr:MAG: hypothetical protein Ct9H300mP30_2950 [Euryarchaeota archaeon]
MNNSSGDVVSLLLENYVPGEHLEVLFNQTGILDRVFVHQPGQPWPSIGDMVLNGTDLVVYWDYQHDERYPWLHHAWTHSWDTPYGEQEQSEMSCRIGRGDGVQPVWHLNNWLSSIYGFADPVRAGQVNDYDPSWSGHWDAGRRSVTGRPSSQSTTGRMVRSPTSPSPSTRCRIGPTRFPHIPSS